MTFKDYFSGHADSYARSRPRYTEELFAYLASVTAGHHLAWDCGTGNGQAAVGMAPYFERVVATDPSWNQLANALCHRKVAYIQAKAEEPGLASRSVDLLTVAQAVHWFDLDAFYAEVKRVLKHDGVCALWCYGHCRISPEVDAILEDFDGNLIRPYRPSEWAAIDDGYRSLSFPFEDLRPPEFTMHLDWKLNDLLGYLDTWSPVRLYLEAQGVDPVDSIREALGTAWGDPTLRKPVLWPVYMRVGHNS